MYLHRPWCSRCHSRTRPTAGMKRPPAAIEVTATHRRSLFLDMTPSGVAVGTPGERGRVSALRPSRGADATPLAGGSDRARGQPFRYVPSTETPPHALPLV